MKYPFYAAVQYCHGVHSLKYAQATIIKLYLPYYVTYSAIPSFHLVCGRLTSRQAYTYVQPADVRC